MRLFRRMRFDTPMLDHGRSGPRRQGLSGMGFRRE